MIRKAIKILGWTLAIFILMIVGLAIYGSTLPDQPSSIEAKASEKVEISKVVEVSKEKVEGPKEVKIDESKIEPTSEVKLSTASVVSVTEPIVEEEVSEEEKELSQAKADSYYEDEEDENYEGTDDISMEEGDQPRIEPFIVKDYGFDYDTGQTYYVIDFTNPIDMDLEIDLNNFIQIMKYDAPQVPIGHTDSFYSAIVAPGETIEVKLWYDLRSQWPEDIEKLIFYDYMTEEEVWTILQY